METQLIRITDENREAVAEQAGELLRAGKLVAIPTETVYGLAANAFRDEAIREIFAVKGRPTDNPLIVHVSDHIMLKRVVSNLPPDAATLIKAFWPGPLTLVLPKAPEISELVTGGLDTVAVRMPSQPTAAGVIARAGLPLAAPSANTAGRPSSTMARHVYDDLCGKIPLIIDDGPCAIGLESTVLSLSGEQPIVLRPGIVTLEQIQAYLPDAVLSPSVMREVAEGDRVESPGMKYKHYAPRADVTLVRGSLEAFIEYVARHASTDTYAICFDGEEEKIGIPSISMGPANQSETQANRLFAVLRAVDSFGATSVLVRCASETDGIAMAVYNRLVRAAGHKVVEL